MRKYERKVRCPKCHKNVTVRSAAHLGGIYAGFCTPCQLRVGARVHCGKVTVTPAAIQRAI